MQASLKLAGGENCVSVFLRQTLTGTGFSMVGRREAFHGLGVQDVIEFNSD
jgi:hypothetical protein